MGETPEYAMVAKELERLAQCADIPARRRRQLLQLAAQLAPQHWTARAFVAEPFVDPYYRRGGMRMRLPKGELGSPRRAFADTFHAVDLFVAKYLPAPNPEPEDMK